MAAGPTNAATMLRSHPADATQIQRVAVPTPCNNIPLNQFFATIAIVIKISAEVPVTCGLAQPPTTTPPTISLTQPEATIGAIALNCFARAVPVFICRSESNFPLHIGRDTRQ
jgi:hypothetical protein